MGDDGRGSLISPGGVAPSWMAGVSASVVFPCTIKVQKKISSGTGSPRCSQKKSAVKRLCVVYVMKFVNMKLAWGFWKNC